MKKFIRYLLVLIVAFLALPVLVMSSARAADAGACYAISDADTRTYCLARARAESSMCYAVHRADLRAQCLAEVRK